MYYFSIFSLCIHSRSESTAVTLAEGDAVEDSEQDAPTVHDHTILSIIVNSLSNPHTVTMSVCLNQVWAIEPEDEVVTEGDVFHKTRGELLWYQGHLGVEHSTNTPDQTNGWV